MPDSGQRRGQGQLKCPHDHRIPTRSTRRSARYYRVVGRRRTGQASGKARRATGSMLSVGLRCDRARRQPATGGLRARRPDRRLPAIELHPRVVAHRPLARANRECANRRGAPQSRPGQTMFEWAINACRERGCGLVQLTTDKARPEALHFLRDAGLCRKPRRPQALTLSRQPNPPFGPAGWTLACGTRTPGYPPTLALTTAYQ